MASIGENGARKLILPAPERKKKKKIAKSRFNRYQINEMMGFCLNVRNRMPFSHVRLIYGMS
jgi:hypothetical protein